MGTDRNNIVDVLYAGFPTRLPDRLWADYFNCLPDDLGKKTLKYRRWQDQYASLFGKLLLIKGLQKYSLGKETLKQLQYTSHGRPFIRQNIDFNITHSGRFVLCAIGMNMKIGVDIEEVKPIDFAHVDMTMSKEQWDEINAAEDTLSKFYDYWTIKESIIKADGRGVTIPLKALTWKEGGSTYEDSKWHLQSLSIDDGYAAHMATNLSRLEVGMEKIDFYNDRCRTFFRR
ncbi:MAG: 4'-phosphopantetheinyl transferase superfamily protein [Roseivirga sp.]|nr:4'-phosphopantetheinyl transferase superfamily protein [Roseivirga sp.]